MSEVPSPDPAEEQAQRLRDSLADLSALVGFSPEELEAIYGAEAASTLLQPDASEDPDVSEDVVERARATAESDSTPVRPALSMEDLSRAHAQERLDDAKQDRELRKALAWWSIGAASSMLLVTTYVFVLYVISQWGHVPMGAIIAYLSSTVAEVLGIVILVANYLFPKPK